MNVSISHVGDVAVMHVNEPRLTYPMLGDFASSATALITKGETKVVVDLSKVNYVDSATIGCLMDLYRQASAAGGTLKLAGVQKRYEKSARTVDFTDGLSLEFDTWRFNLRGSNTEPLVRLNVESRGDEALMRRKTEELLALLDG